MIWLVRDFDLLAVVLRAALLSFEALSVGGILFLIFAARGWQKFGSSQRSDGCQRLLRAAALGLAVCAVLSAAITTSLLMSTTGLALRELVGADYFIAAAVLCLSGLLVLLLARVDPSPHWERLRLPIPGALAAVVVAASVSTSHALARLDHRWLLAGLTAAHHAGVALWIGAMPYLLVLIKSGRDEEQGRRMISRYSLMALLGVALLISAGAGMAWFYLGLHGTGEGGTAPSGLTGLYSTSYGVMLLAKLYLLLLMLGLGSINYALARTTRGQSMHWLARLSRFSEIEIGLGFTAILAAASLTAQPPAVDLVRGRLSGHEIAARFRVKAPSMRSPVVAALTAPSSIETAVRENEFRGVSVSDAEDRAWSEYNHHWAGLIVASAGALALLSRWRRAPWALHWPLAFAGLAAFILLRADPENWPLGPRPFWASFSQPDVLQHRLFAALILGFTGFEWGVQTGRWSGASWSGSRRTWRRYSRLFPFVFPVLCCAGGALMLLHSHAIGEPKEEVLTEISHTAIALLGVTAGCARWLELRLTAERQNAVSAWSVAASGTVEDHQEALGPVRAAAGYIWPIGLVLAGLVLLNYRES